MKVKLRSRKIKVSHIFRSSPWMMGPINHLSALTSFTYIQETEKVTLIQTIISHVFSANPSLKTNRLSLFDPNQSSHTNLLYLAVEDARLVPLESIYD